MSLPVDTDIPAPATLALGSSYTQLLGALSGWFRARRVPPEEAKDLAQDTILRTLVHLQRHGQRGEDLKPLAFTIARNLLAERARRAAGVVVTLTDEIDVADSDPTPLDRVLQSEEKAAVHQALAALGPRHRRVIELWMRGDGPADIARALGIKRNAADALLHRARRRLAVMLESSRGAFGAVVGLLPLRLRVAMRRAASTINALDPGARFASAAAGLTAIGVTAAIVVGSSGPSATHVPGASAPKPAAVTSAVTNRARATTKPTAPSAPTSVSPAGANQAGFDAALGEHSEVGVWSKSTDPNTGRQTKRGLDVSYNHGSGTPVDDTLAPVIQTACDTALECK